MTTRRRLVLPAATIAVAAFLAFGANARLAAATTPPTNPPTAPATTSAAASGTSPAGNEFVESWALGPAGSLNPDEPGNRAQLSYAADPGAVINDAVNVYNYGNVQLTFSIYATDAFDDAKGQFALLAGDKAPTDAGTWATVAQQSVSVPPGKQATIPITIKIPADATPGDHAGAVLASNVSASTNSAGAVVNFDRRTGTRMYIRVNGPLTPELAVSNVVASFNHSMNPLGGSAHLTYRVQNRGNVRLSGTATVTVTGPFGIGEKTVKLADVSELLPGGSIDVAADVADVPELFVGSTTVRVKPLGSGNIGSTKESTGTANSFAPPLGVLLVVLALLCGILVRRAYRRHRTGAQAATPNVRDEGGSERKPELQST